MTTGAEWNDRERSRARQDGVTVVKNSGRGWRKGDARDERFLIDYKFTSKGSYSVNLKYFKEFQKQAWDEQREAVIVPIFDEYKGKALAIVDWDWLRALIEEYEQQIADLDGEISWLNMKDED